MTNRIDQLCKEFDEWTKELGMPFARLGLAKRLAELEAENERVHNEKDAWKRTANTMEEAVDNVRAALGLESTHCLIIHDQVADVVAENARLRTALEDIANPLQRLKRNMPEGYKLDGHTTTSLLNSVDFHKDIARQALNAETNADEY